MARFFVGMPRMLACAAAGALAVTGFETTVTGFFVVDELVVAAGAAGAGVNEAPGVPEPPEGAFAHGQFVVSMFCWMHVRSPDWLMLSQ